MAFLDKNNLANTGFYYTDHSDVVCCLFCVAKLGIWQEGDDVLKEHQRWNPNWVFMRGVSVGNSPVGSSDQPTASSEQPSRSRNMCGSHFEYRRNSQPERCKYTCLYFIFFVYSFYCPINNF